MNNVLQEADYKSEPWLRELITEPTQHNPERNGAIRPESHSEQLVELSLLAASLAHEIRNSLAVVTVAVEVLELEYSEQLEKHHMFKEILRRLHGVSDLVGDLLECTKPLVTSKQVVCLLESLDAVLSVLATEPRLQCITVVKEYRCNPALWADPKVLERLFLNLILNAVQAMKFSGELTIRVAENGRDILISFIDQGCGMEKAVQERIFGPFFTTKAGGSGLGLFLCKKYVESHDGCIDVETEPGRGSTFTVRLPRRPRSIAASPDYSEVT